MRETNTDKPAGDTEKANMKWTVIIILITAALCLGGWYLWEQRSSGKENTGPVTVKVERRRMTVAVEANGKVASNQDILIKCKASGNVISLPFDINDRVKKGDVVLQLDTDDQDRLVAKAEAALSAAQAGLAQAKADRITQEQAIVVNELKADANLKNSQAKLDDAKNKMQRTKALLEKKLVSQEEYETSATTVESAQADLLLAQAAKEDIKTQKLALDSQAQLIASKEAMVKQNQVDLANQKLQLEYATVRSPVDGVILNLVSGNDSNGNPVNTRVGTLVQSGTGGSSGGTTVMTISDLSKIRILATVDETDIRNVLDPQRLPPGTPLQKVIVTADAYKGVTFDGVVVRTSPGGKLISNVVTIEVQIEVTSPNKLLLRPEMTANVKIIKTDEDNVLTLPVQAVTLMRGGRGGGERRHAETQAATEVGVSATRQAESQPGAEATTRRGARRERPMMDEGEAIASLDRPQPAIVKVLKDGKQEERKIMVGETDDVFYKIISGLEEGEEVVIPQGTGPRPGGQGQGGPRGGFNMMGGGRGPR
jgi:multidrug efflux pump subunit AcrA (membrane-fusion protein)